MNEFCRLIVATCVVRDLRFDGYDRIVFFVSIPISQVLKNIKK